MKNIALFVLSGTYLLGAQSSAQEMSFFITSTGLGRGGDLGGLEGADAHCQALAATADAGDKTWRAYLSTSAPGDTPAVDARSRIGEGPWYNASGVLIARNLTDLHVSNNISGETALDENGNPVRGRGESPNQHDILTGSRPDGTAHPPGDASRYRPRATRGPTARRIGTRSLRLEHTCSNWTSSSGGRATVGHHDRQGGGYTSWNSAHLSSGCSQRALISTGGSGLFYCFATD